MLSEIHHGNRDTERCLLFSFSSLLQEACFQPILLQYSRPSVLCVRHWESVTSWRKMLLLNLTLEDPFFFPFCSFLLSLAATHFSFDKFLPNVKCANQTSSSSTKVKLVHTCRVWFFPWAWFSGERHWCSILYKITSPTYNTKALTSTHFKIHSFVHKWCIIIRWNMAKCVERFGLICFQLTLHLDILQSVLICHLHPCTNSTCRISKVCNIGVLWNQFHQTVPVTVSRNTLRWSDQADVNQKELSYDEVNRDWVLI